MAQSRARAIVPDYNPYGSRQISTNTSNSISRPSFNRPQSIDLRKSKYTQTTYNENYPWLNESSYKKLEAAVEKMGLSGEEKRTAMDQWYRNNVKYLLNDQTLEERAKAINEQAYQAAELKNPEADAQLRMTEFSQALKKKYNLDATADDLEVFNTFVSDLWEEWVNLAWQYLSWENKKLRYDAGLETWWEKAADFWVWVLQSPWKRGYNMVWQWMDKLGEALADKIEWTDLANLIQKKAIEAFWEDAVKAYQQQMAQEKEDWTQFNGREATDIRTPLLWEERANNWWTKAWEVVWDIGSAIALTAPMWSALAPAMATQWVGNAALLWAIEWGIDTLATQYGSQWNLDISPMQAALGIWGGALGGVITNKLANLPKNQQENIRKEASKYIEKSIKPTVKGKQSQVAYDKFIDDALDVTDYMSKNKKVLEFTDDAWEVVRWELPKNLRETSEALSNMKKYIYDQYNGIAQKAWDAWAKVNLNKLYDKLDDLANNNAVNLANPWLKNAIESYKNQLLQYSDDLGNITIQEAQDTMQYYNKILDAYFKNPWAMATDTSKNIVVANLKRWLAEAVDESMDDVLNAWINKWSTASQQYRDWKQLYSKIKTIEDEVSKRALVEARKNTKGLSTDIIDALAWGNLVEWLLTQNPTWLLKWAVMKWINAFNKYLNSPNTQIRNLFTLVDKVNNPNLIQTATSNLWSAIRSTAQSTAPLVWTVTPGLAWLEATELTND